MKLLSFSYKVAQNDRINDWGTDQIDLNCLNLIVGKNAVGKSRVTKVILGFAEMLNQKSVIYSGDWSFCFVNDERDLFDYSLKKNSNNISEILLINGELKLERKNSDAKVFSEFGENMVEISPPLDKLVMHVRRDILEYPYFEDLINWAENTHLFKFGYIHPNSFLESDKPERGLITIEDVPKLISELDDETKGLIVNEFNEIGYDIEKFYLKKEDDFKQEKLFIKEHLLKYAISQSVVSQGMFRAFTLLMYLNYIILKKKVSTFIVDDLCEGLDYERATKFGKLLFNKMKKENIQFIASTNDSFLMDVVDIKYWNVLKRNESKITSFNYKNSKEKFDNFKFTGLSNFDFFSSDYLNEPINS